jgi:hypothetical protein
VVCHPSMFLYCRTRQLYVTFQYLYTYPNITHTNHESKFISASLLCLLAIFSHFSPNLIIRIPKPVVQNHPSKSLCLQTLVCCSNCQLCYIWDNLSFTVPPNPLQPANSHFPPHYSFAGLPCT